jgi:hypothetical protein
MSHELKSLLTQLAAWKAKQLLTLAGSYHQLAVNTSQEFQTSKSYCTRKAIHYRKAWSVQMAACKRLRSVTAS